VAENSITSTAPAGSPAGAVLPPGTPPRKPRIHLFALRRDIPRWTYYCAAVVGFLSILAVWWWFSHLPSEDENVYLPKPELVWTTAIEVLKDETVWQDIKISFLRVTAGFLLSAAFAIPLGIWIGSWKLVEGVTQPLIEFVRYVPVPALIPILMLFFGLEELPKVMLIFVGTFFQLVLMVADEVRRVPQELLSVSYTLGAKRGEVVRLVLMRAAMPGIFDALRLCNGWAWTYLIVAELIAANEGLGYRILKFYRFVQVPKIFVYLFILGAIGLLLDYIFRKFNAHVFHWADTTKR
jgi:NitT/TauT family transport system permease protein